MGKVTAKPEPYQDAESKHDKKKKKCCETCRVVYLIYFLHLTQPLCDLQNGFRGGKMTGEAARVR